MAVVTRYVNTASTAGTQDGTTNTPGSSGTAAFATLRQMIDAIGTTVSGYAGSGNSLRIYCEGTAADTSDVYQTPWDMSTTTTEYLEIIGEQSPLHPNFSTAKSGKFDTSLYRLERTNEHVLYNNIPGHVYWRGIQAKCTANNAGTYNCFRSTNANQTGTSGFFEISHCIAVGVVSGGSTVYGFQPGIPGAGGTSYIYNCLAYDCTYGYVNANDGTNAIYNCTAANCTYGYTEDTAGVLKNCLATACTVGFVGTWTGSDYNAEDDGNGAPGANSRSAVTFTFVNAASDDYHLGSADAGAKNYGVSNPGSGLFSDDIDGGTRSGSWDIGMDEEGVVGGGTVTLWAQSLL